MATTNLDMSRHIVVTGLPKAEPEKRTKLLSFFEKKVAEALNIPKAHFQVKLLFDSEQLVSGAFIEFAKAEDANKALAVLNGFALSRLDKLEVNPWSDFCKYEEYDEEYHELELKVDDVGNTSSVTNPFVMDPEARPQLIIKGNKMYDVEWYWMSSKHGKLELLRKPSAAHDDFIAQWTEMDRGSKRLQRGLPKPFPMWSPRGSFLLTQHHSGIRVWGGATMGPLGEILETGISAVHVSPTERYIVVLSKELHVYDLKTFKHMRNFKGLDVDLDKWPIAKFNADDSVLAIQTRDNRLNMYETDTMKLLAGTKERVAYTVEIPGLSNFEWSPTNPKHIAYVSVGETSVGWRVKLDNVFVDDMFVTMEPLGNRNFQNTKRVDFLWHPTGQYTAAKVTKNAHVEYCIFRVGAKSVSAEQIDMTKVGQPLRFAWQPDAPCFVISTAAVTGKHAAIHFFSATKLGFKLAQSFETEVDGLFWAPKGGRLVAVNHAKSKIDLYAVSSADGKVTKLSELSHPFVTNVEWDPTGRFFVTYTSALKQEHDTRMIIFNINGASKVDQKIERLSHVSWRPLPPPLLSEEEIAKIRQNLPSLSKRFEEEEDKIIRAKEEQEEAKRRDMENRYIKIMNDIHADHVRKGYKQTRTKLRALAPFARRENAILEQYKSQAKEVTVVREEIDSEVQI